MDLKYSNACKEVVMLFDYFLDENDLSKIPEKQIEHLKKNANQQYNFAIDESKELEEQEISKEAKAIIVSLYKKYFTTNEQKKKVDEIIAILDRQKILKRIIIQALEDNIKISMAGMAAEKVFVGTFENGNTSDLEKATGIAKSMVTRYGMSDIGFAYIEIISGEMEKIVLDEVNKILKKAFEDAIEIIENNKIKMEKTIEYLMEHKDINEEEFIKVFNE